jgi:hypothetical protein
MEDTQINDLFWFEFETVQNAENSLNLAKNANVKKKRKKRKKRKKKTRRKTNMIHSPQYILKQRRRLKEYISTCPNEEIINLSKQTKIRMD